MTTTTIDQMKSDLFDLYVQIELAKRRGDKAAEAERRAEANESLRQLKEKLAACQK